MGFVQPLRVSKSSRNQYFVRARMQQKKIYEKQLKAAQEREEEKQFAEDVANVVQLRGALEAHEVQKWGRGEKWFAEEKKRRGNPTPYLCSQKRP